MVPRVPAEYRTLGQDFYHHLIENTIRYNEHAAKENPNDAEAHTKAVPFSRPALRAPEARGYPAAAEAPPSTR